MFFSIVFLATYILGSAFSAFAATGDEPTLNNPRQYTYDGPRSGEGYFSQDGRYMIFQSERQSDNPFYQIYVMDREDGETWKVSPGTGMTTCAWIHPSNELVMFASTHLDPDAVAKQEEEFRRRQEGGNHGYNWDFDKHYDIFSSTLRGRQLVNLTNTEGYDAEGSYSPDGGEIVFASNRSAYEGNLTEEQKELFEKDPSAFVDLYIMNADGSNVRRLTQNIGYDGGPFFSADGSKIVWRRFDASGRVAEVYTMNRDGSDKRQITKMGVMPWAPYFHPSGDYIIYATNVHGHRNFELYIIDAEGQKEPIRITDTAGFDGLPVFTPNGKELTWTSSRHGEKGGQIFIADWNDALARELLGLSATKPTPGQFSSSITADDMRRHVEYLASSELAGRLTGTKGEQLATEYAAEWFRHLGLKQMHATIPMLQDFNFTAGVSLGQDNQLRMTLEGAKPIEQTVDTDWRPLSFSENGTFATTEIVFAGYGLQIPKNDEFEAYDSYVHLDVKDKWVMVFRYVPEGVEPKLRQHYFRHAGLRRKAMLARELGAKGLIVVSGPNSRVQNELIELSFDASMAGSGVFGLSVTDAFAQAIFQANDRSIQTLQDELDKGQMMQGFALTGSIDGAVALVHEQKTGRNVVARLQLGAQPSDEVIVVGAHLDHLGHRTVEGSNQKEIHYGADDNASGSSAVLEIAAALASDKRKQEPWLGTAKRDVVFILWSGEELGLLGSSYFAKSFNKNIGALYPRIASYLNMDMIGRYRDRLMLQAVGSSVTWKGIIERLSFRTSLNLKTQNDPYLPTDSTSFYLKGVPTLNFFTGSHDQYHTPLDRPETLNYNGATDVAALVLAVTSDLMVREAAPAYTKVEEPGNGNGGFRVYLGTIPDYSETSESGVLLSGVKADSPAAKAGLIEGDLIVSLAGVKIANIYDYTYALGGLRAGEAVEIIVLRNNEEIKLQITPASRS